MARRIHSLTTLSTGGTHEMLHSPRMFCHPRHRTAAFPSYDRRGRHRHDHRRFRRKTIS
ncbi:MAG: hypothetical protein LZF60_90012 [Nitrospira sp.]|nr:MAG: hypothetical protein LZF60_90012 [Nitrospira sp.]